jgi:hypothetical protein
MVATQNIMTKQLSESTFFNLLRNHKEVLLKDLDKKGKKGFDEQMPNAMKLMNDYATHLLEEKFPNSHSTFHSPESLYNGMETLEPVGKSLIHMLDYIKDMLKDEEFYHRTLYHNLSKSEKLLIGMILANKLEGNKSYSFNYVKDFDDNAQYFNEEQNGYFPPVSVHQSIDQVVIPRIDSTNRVSRNEIDNELSITASPTNKFCKLKEIQIKFFNAEDNLSILLDTPIDTHNVIVPDNLVYANLFRLFNQKFLEVMSKVAKVEVHFSFIYSYKSKHYTIEAKYGYNARALVTIAGLQTPHIMKKMQEWKVNNVFMIEPLIIPDSSNTV